MAIGWSETESKLRAEAILARGEGEIVQQADALFTVRSQSQPGIMYTVRLAGSAPSCDCEFNRDTGEACIHLLATQFYIERTTANGKKERVRLTYPQAWSAYNAAQANEVRLFDTLLADLVKAVPEPPYKGNGRPALPLKEQAFCAIQKVYSQLSMRRAASLFGNARERGQIEHAPHFNVSSKFLNRPDATPVLRELVRLTALPLAGVEREFAIDSTGFRTTSFGDYCQEKHGPQRKNVWLKAHLSVGVTTHIVADVVVTDGNDGDSPQFIPLLNGTAGAGFALGAVVADKAYSSRDNHEAAKDAGAEAFIPFKDNATGKTGGSPAWRKAFHFFQMQRDAFEARYHKRSNVESAISAAKRKLGETLRSKNRVAQENELLCKVVAYNLTVLIHEMYEHGLEPAWLMPSQKVVP